MSTRISASGVSKRYCAKALANCTDDEFIYKNFSFLLQIHDSVGFSCKIPKVWSEWLNLSKGLLRIKNYLEIPLTTSFKRTFTIPADLMIGMNLNKDHCADFKASEIPNDVEKFAKLLSEETCLIS